MRKGGVGGFTRELALKGAKYNTIEKSKKAGKTCALLKVGYHKQTKAQLSANGRKGGLTHKGKPKSLEWKAKTSKSITLWWRSRKVETICS